MKQAVETRRASGTPVAALVGVGVVALAGLTALPLPFTGDQAFYSLGARAIGQGKLLYRDYWDTKQPGVVVFFRAAGALFGFGEIGVHAFELLWQLVFAALVCAVMRRRVRNPWALTLAPVLAIGSYYVIATPYELTQLEALIGLPVLAGIWCAAHALDASEPRHAARWAAAAGFSVFLIGYFKLVLLIVPAGCLLVVFWHYRRDGRPAAADIPRVLRWFTIGAVVPSVAVAAWVVASGLSSEVWHTWFVMPFGAAHRSGRSTATLRQSIETFGKISAPLWLLAAAGIRRARPRSGDAVAQAAVVWIVTGMIAFLVQLWWVYLLFLLVAPLGILATFGADELWSMRDRVSRNVAIGTVVVLVGSTAFAAHRFAIRANDYARHGFARGTAHRDAFQDAQWPALATARSDARFLHRYPASYRVVVWGDPLILYLADREPAIGVTGWAPEQIDARLWKRAAKEFDEQQPQLVFVDDFSSPYLRTRGERFDRLLARDYHVAGRTTDGVWYLRKGAGG